MAKLGVLSIIAALLCVGAMAANVDEDRYVEYATKAKILLYETRDNPELMSRRMEELINEYPDSQTDSWLDFEEKFMTDKELNNRVCKKIVGKLRSEGYDAYMGEIVDEISGVYIKGKLEEPPK